MFRGAQMINGSSGSARRNRTSFAGWSRFNGTHGDRSRKIVRAAIIAVVALLAIHTAPTQAGAAVGFVQGNYAVPQSPQSSVTVAFPGAQTAGNLNVAVVGWNDSSATVTSVTDSAGNTYVRAVGPTIIQGRGTQSIYYATNIRGAASNAVTVSYSAAAVFPDIRVLEYSGLDTTSPLNAIAAATGSGQAATSGSLTTTVPNVLLVAANLVGASTKGPGPSFTSR